MHHSCNHTVVVIGITFKVVKGLEIVLVDFPQHTIHIAAFAWLYICMLGKSKTVIDQLSMSQGSSAWAP
jgi:hypothetical protein